MKQSMQSFANQSLSRQEMKKVLGGNVACRTGNCQVKVKRSDGTYASYDGQCAAATVIGYNGMNTTKCICNSQYGYYDPTSNGGVSRCQA